MRTAIERRSDERDDPGRLLATALSLNVLFSAGCGLVLLAGAPALSGLVDVPAWLLAGLGAGLLGFVGLLLWILASPARLVVGRKRVWAAVADVADDARFTSTIAASEIVSGEGEGMVRACTDRRGGRWSETCPPHADLRRASQARRHRRPRRQVLGRRLGTEGILDAYERQLLSASQPTSPLGPVRWRCR